MLVAAKISKPKKLVKPKAPRPMFKSGGGIFGGGMGMKGGMMNCYMCSKAKKYDSISGVYTCDCDIVDYTVEKCIFCLDALMPGEF